MTEKTNENIQNFICHYGRQNLFFPFLQKFDRNLIVILRDSLDKKKNQND